MNYYKHTDTGEVFAYASEEERQRFGIPDLEAMTQADLEEHIAAQQDASPRVVSRFQARAALHAFGILEQVDALMSDPQTDVIRRLAWTDAQEFRRDSPTLNAVAQELGLSKEVLDNMFKHAAGLQA